MTATQTKRNVPNPAAWVGRIWDRMPPASNQISMKAWMEAFGLSDGDPRVFEAVGCFIDMAIRTEEAVRAIRHLPDPVKTHLLGWTPVLDEIVNNTAANGAWSNIRIPFTEVRRNLLHQCEIWLDADLLTESESSDELASLLQQIATVRSMVLDATLDSEFRALLLDMLEALHRAVAEYAVRGSKGVFTSIGEIMSLMTRYSAEVKTDEESGALDQVVALVKKVGTIAATGTALAKLGGLGYDALKYLSGP